ncbi:MAG: hypothetical protein KAS64_09015 [Spirochaetes bacterium]|nr:hypothetical protein [Spirochaetota bacterium]
MRNKKLGILAAVGLLFLMVNFSGCALANLQTANTVRPGHMEIFFAGTIPMDAEGFIPEIGARFGLSDNIDLGVRLFGLGFFGDIKLALFQSREAGPSLALNAGVGYSEFGDAGSLTILDAGAIFSISMGGLTPYVAAKYRSFQVGVGFDSDDFAFTGDFIIGTIGVELFSGSTVNLLIEANRLFSTAGSASSDTVISGGIKFNF